MAKVIHVGTNGFLMYDFL